MMVKAVSVATSVIRSLLVAIFFLSHYSLPRAQDIYADAELNERIHSGVDAWIRARPGAVLKGFSVSNLHITDIEIEPNIYSKTAYDDFLQECLASLAVNSPTPPSPHDFSVCSSGARDVAGKTVDPSITKRRKVIDYRNCSAVDSDEQLDFTREIRTGKNGRTGEISKLPVKLRRASR